MPLCAAGAGPYGNPGKHRLSPDPDRAERRLNLHVPKGRVHNGVSISHRKTPGTFVPGVYDPFPLRGKGQGLYPHITVLHISSHPAWRDEGGVIGEARLFSGLPWPGVRGGILQPVSFPP